MKPVKSIIRRWILVGFTLVIFGVYVARLMNIQIVRATEIRERIEAGTVSKQTMSATRGEIVDRNGIALVSNRLGYDVVIDKAFFPREEQNDIILSLLKLFESNDAVWYDNLPITKAAPFQFIPDYDSEVEKLKAHLDVQPYTNVSDVMFRLIERYRLESYSEQQARLIAGVRYEMERRGFEINVPYTFASDISIDLVLKIKEHSHDLAGVDIAESALRSYDRGDIAPHLIGMIGPIYAEDWADLKKQGYAMNDTVGKSGVEYYFESQLRGEKGERLITLDSRNQVTEARESVPPVAGNTLVLTLDANLQDTAQRAIEAQIKNLQQTARAGEGKEADAGTVAVIHVKTGQILALATYPSYNLNTYLEDYPSLIADKERAPLVNRALEGLYAPGSTFKPVVATAGLANNVITEGSNVYCGMVYTRFHDYQPRCLSAHGPINLTNALSVSCNIFFYDTGWNTGIDQIDRFAKQYGLGEPTGIELREVTGQRSNPEVAKQRGETWSNGDVLQSSIGQLHQKYSPLQLANYAATIANRGTRMKATIVKEIRDYARGTVIQPFEAQVADNVDASPEMFEAVIRGMIAASRSGSARAHFANYPFDVASKTGTPETIDLPNSTFICFGPAEEPEIAIAVVIEKGWHGYTGAPVAKAIMDEYFGIDSPNPLLPKAEEGADQD